ncbi:hypothetical protein PoB_002858900 [Plakobranchus ocellatus]|uniref:Uncharacterized protein n=1 Tax=Plakobranchus ocellatus TaxID=259542 RepID=A0AAV4A778_9GAST|nr:hypothetical protein PoB_002858900 [Plakobranchus ocellatus]
MSEADIIIEQGSRVKSSPSWHVLLGDFANMLKAFIVRGVGGTVASESALRSAGTLLSRVRAPPPAPWPDGGPEA